jgi:uncharacterized protein (DUF58 family)
VLLPTGLGLKALAFFAVLVGAFYAAPYMNLFFLLLSFLAVMAVLSVWWTWRNVAGVDGEVLQPHPVQAGKSCPLQVVARSPRRRPHFALQCALDLGGAVVPVAVWPSLHGEAAVTGELPPLARGVHPVREARLQSTYPFGFARAWQAIPAPEHIAVYPAPADLGDARTRNDLLADLCGSTAFRNGEMGPSGVREYRPGDEPRNVHWKASARRGSLAVCEWEGSALTGIEVCLDLRAEGEVFEDALSVLAALALWARARKEGRARSSQDHTGTYGEGHRPFRELLHYLAAARPLPADGPPPPAVSPGVLRLPAAGGSRE